MILRHSTLLLIVLSVCHLTLQSPSLFSLQPAVEALSEREAQLALKDEIENGNLDDLIENDDFEWNNDYGRGQRAAGMARYLSRSDYDDNDYRKRSMYRKRDASVFRERARLPPHNRRQQQAELAERFLKAIEEEREKEREEEYRDELKNLWNRYQKEESNIERELFNENDENDIESDYPLSYQDDIARKKKKRQRGEVEIAPYYWNDKRSMPLLPWLPATRKKRFPVTKRSPKTSETEMVRAVAETSDKVAKDLQGIFGNVVNADNMKANGGSGAELDDDKKKKKKRSSGDEMMPAHQNSDKAHETKVEIEGQQQQPRPLSNVNVKKRNVKRSAANDDDDDEGDNDNDNDDEEGPDDDTDDDDSEEEERRKKKKKREAKKSLEVVGEREIPEKKISIRKKSVEWSNIFGFDRKKKSSGMLMMMQKEAEEERRRKKRQDEDDEDSSAEEDEEEEGNDYEYNDNDDRRRRKKKRSKGEDKLDAMDRKLKTIENLIVEDTAKFYEHNNENLNPSEVREIKSQISDRLATAYSIEKMRKAIGRLKQSIAFQRGLEQNLLEAAEHDNDDNDDKKKAKRVAVKKEKAEFDNNDHEIESPFKKVSEAEKINLGDNDDDDDDDDDKKKKKKKKKRSQKKSINTINEEQPMSEGYMGGSMFQAECPVLDAIEKRCRGIDILSGAHQNLMEACGEHQLCYLCGDAEIQCDYKYLYDVKEICGYNAKCKMIAAQALTMLRSAAGNKIGPRECIRNPCLNSALRSIGY